MFSAIKDLFIEIYLIFAREWENQTATFSFTAASIGFFTLLMPLLMVVCVLKLCAKLTGANGGSTDKLCETYTNDHRVNKPVTPPKLSKATLALIKESKRWLRQAAFDYNAAKNDLETEDPAPEWVCFKCQQAAEKSLKALLCLCSSLRNASVLQSGHNISELAACVEDETIKNTCNRLQALTGFASQMRYPDFLPFPKVPRDMYTTEKAREAFDLTGQLLLHINDTYFVN